ncbi:MAG: imidazole glycerol phosphate synthase subunit HisH [bacterium]
MTQTIAVVDYGMGNLRSVVKALEHVAQGNANVILTHKPGEVAAADRVLFPGQGAARDCVRALSDTGMGEVVMEAAKEKPFLGICMGMQVLMTHSQENEGVDCLGMYPGDVVRFDEVVNGERYKIPHMGWNTVKQTQPHPLWKGIGDDSHFYFVHSYHVQPEDTSLMAGETEYGHVFTSAIARDNVFAIQCHPEKSAQAGLQLLSNFVEWNGEA